MLYAETFASYSRFKFLRIALLAMMTILFGRLVQLQLVHSEELGRKSDENAIRMVVKEPVRGYVYDRNGKLLIDVGPSYTIMITPAEFKKETIPLLAGLLNVEPGFIEEQIRKGRRYTRFAQSRIIRDVDFATLSAIEEHMNQLPGVSYQVESKRMYREGIRASHLFGYVKEISESQLTRSGPYYRQGDMIGSAGIEASYENFLRGAKGYEFFSVNAHGQMIGRYADGATDIVPGDGYDLILALDAGLQFTAESLMTANNFRGAIVAMDPRDGGILAMVSKPDFDPMVFSGQTQGADWETLLEDPEKPLFNRATLTRYPPGSTFKMVLAAAALDAGIINEKTTFHCPGIFYLGRHPFRDLHAHGNVAVVEAIQRSCNVFFYKLMLKTNFNDWTKTGKDFGFGKITGVDIGEETAGLLPSPQIFDRMYGVGKWTQGYTVSISIGQGEVGVSPLQMAVFTSALANGTTVFQPYAVRSIYNKSSRELETIQHDSHQLNNTPHTLELIREGMRRVVEMPGGTGGGARLAAVQSAGKTGTAQNPHGEDHAWYVGFAPFESPTIAVVVMLENAGFGGAKAAPLARQIISKYLTGTAIASWAPYKKEFVSARSSHTGVTPPEARPQ